MDNQYVRPLLDCVWGPQRPKCTDNLWDPHQNVGFLVTRMDNGSLGALSPSAGPQ